MPPRARCRCLRQAPAERRVPLAAQIFTVVDRSSRYLTSYQRGNSVLTGGPGRRVYASLGLVTFLTESGARDAFEDLQVPRLQ